jgi:hypothetical protein
MISMQIRHIVRIYKIGLMIGAHIGSERSGGSRRCRGSSERQEEDLVGGDGERRGEEALERLRVETDTLELTSQERSSCWHYIEQVASSDHGQD